MLEAELLVARRLCREAGALALSMRQDPALDVALKAGDLGPVTAADLAADRLIADGLREAFPDDVIVTEETAKLGRTHGDRRVWFVDPIDGTREYIKGRDDFAVMIGLVIEGKNALGVVYQPPKDTMSWGVVGDGEAFQRVGSADVTALKVSGCSAPARACMVRSNSHPSEAVTQLCERLGIERWHRMGSFGLKTVQVASGLADAYVNLSARTAVWDSAGPVAILQAAGGTFTTARGEVVDYRTIETFHEDGIIVSNGALHDALVEGALAGRGEGR